MAEKSGVYVYAHNTTNFDNTGLVGDLMPLQAVFKEEKNGISQITLRLSYDQYKKWQSCKVGNYIKARVPVRVPPVINEDQYSNVVKVYRYEEQGG